LSAETGNSKIGVKNPRRNGLFLIEDGFRSSGGLDGGHDRDRTCDPYHVKVVLHLLFLGAKTEHLALLPNLPAADDTSQHMTNGLTKISRQRFAGEDHTG
jgi:hypothetical protein